MATSTIWRLPKVLRHTGLSRSTIYEMIDRGDFPRQVKLGRRAVGWIGNDVVEWIHAKIDSQSSHGHSDDT
jgi:prophage regulatory protein